MLRKNNEYFVRHKIIIQNLEYSNMMRSRIHYSTDVEINELKFSKDLKKSKTKYYTCKFIIPSCETRKLKLFSSNALVNKSAS